MNSAYKILFAIELQHSYYRNGNCKDFTIIPSRKTAALLKDQQLMVKLFANKLFVLAKVISSGPDADKPFIPISAETSFLFYLDLNNSSFQNITNLDNDRLGRGERFYFSNRHENASGPVLNLTHPISNFPSLAPYVPGSVADNGSGTVFECIQGTDNSHNTADTAYWYPRTTGQIASAEDMLSLVSSIHRYKTSAAGTSFTVKVFGFNIATGLYDKEITLLKSVYTSDQPIDEIQPDLSQLPAGRYKVSIGTKDYEVLIDDDMLFNGYFGAIEIFSHLPAGTAFSFYDASGKLKDKKTPTGNEWLTYRIQFANRMAYWKYISTRQGVLSIDGASGFAFEPTPAVGSPKEYFTSDKPVPLVEQPWEFKLQLATPVSDEPPLVPNPNPMMPALLSRTATEKDYYCTIYLNY